jgi:hypothetical protein
VFLDVAAKMNYYNDNTIQARRTACSKFFEILEDDQKTIEYVRDNLDVIKARFSNRYKDVRGATVEEYARRVGIVLNDFTSWNTDRAAFERDLAARQSKPAEGERKPRSKPTEASNSNGNGNGAHTAEDVRVVKFPIRPDFDVSITLPKSGITVAELKKLVYFLLPYTNDWEPNDAPRNVFSMLEGETHRS